MLDSGVPAYADGLENRVTWWTQVANTQTVDAAGAGLPALMARIGPNPVEPATTGIRAG
jgi:hypothetical protein